MTKYILVHAVTGGLIGYTDTREQAQAYVERAKAAFEKFRRWTKDQTAYVQKYLADREIVYPNPGIPLARFRELNDLYANAVNGAKAEYAVKYPKPLMPKKWESGVRLNIKEMEELI